jgi:lysozyme
MYGLGDPDSPVDMGKLTASLILHEGDKAYVYDDDAGQPIVKGYTVVGNPTIGIGRLATAARGLSPAERQYLLGNDIAVCIAEAQSQSWWGLVNPCEPRCRAIIEILFELGLPEFNNFHLAVAALNAGDWRTASSEFLNSLWCRQVGERAEILCAMILTGEDPQLI